MTKGLQSVTESISRGFYKKKTQHKGTLGSFMKVEALRRKSALSSYVGGKICCLFNMNGPALSQDVGNIL